MKNKLTIILIGLFLLGNQVTKAQMAGSSHSGLTAICAKYTDQQFGENVFIFDPKMDMAEIQTLIDSLYNQQHPRKGEFSLNRYALFFKPGTYQLDLKLGYYMHLLGLGQSPDEVVIQGTLLSKGLMNNGNVTLNFWRSVENLCLVAPTGLKHVWGVSQAAPLRRVHIKGDIQLHDNGWASGGYLADSKIEGTVLAGPQQQWFSRNVDLNQWKDGSWNILFVGAKNPPLANWPENPYTVIKETPLIREKPYLVFDPSGYQVCLPKLKKNTSGVSWLNGGKDETTLPLAGFYLVKPGVDHAESINAALAQGKNLLFTPGIYVLDQALKVTRPGTLIIGVGMATLVAEKGNSVLEIADVDGVTVCGLTVDAGKIPSETLVRVGERPSTKSHRKDPTFLYDIFIRVGGYGEGKALSCMEINSKNVVVDHTWLWRADHGKEVAWDKNTCKNGLVVNGDEVTVYGLFCEHFQEYQTLWNGNKGKVYFYQSEMPYDPPTAEAFNHGTTNGYASYKVSEGVTRHEAWGLGIYCVFFKAPVVVDQAIETPLALEKDIHHKILYWLNGGNKASLIKSVINGKGGQVDVTKVKTMMD